ncbi:hypothetical protein SAMN05216326_10687 [Nitrosomonas marina]|uniref:Uncharacterized protein n=1 Tax=Nitrosomonas marina TaxID=917 RepID=A0A1I0A8N1_9PROT|nr:hypothetical protein SAMN05216326_10687 [Nitrosomonas marina]
MPSLRFKIVIAKKNDKQTQPDMPGLLQRMKRGLQTYLRSLFNSDALPYFLAPVIFLAMMYLEWLYLLVL